MDLEKRTAEERLIAEREILNFRSRYNACDEAKDGTVLALAQRLAMGKKWLESSLFLWPDEGSSRSQIACRLASSGEVRRDACPAAFGSVV